MNSTMYTYYVNADSLAQPRAFAQPHEAVAFARSLVTGECEVCGVTASLHRSRRTAFNAVREAQAATRLVPISSAAKSAEIYGLLFFATEAYDSDSTAAVWREVFEAAD